jgi:hypothetical protein
MKTFTIALWFALNAGSAFASVSTVASHHPAPAPLIGIGVQGAVAIGGVLLGSKLFRRWKRK